MDLGFMKAYGLAHDGMDDLSRDGAAPEMNGAA